ncbi:hypothetical protein AB4144_38105 [Rhizobiaceae sp. 2RAB30]
MPRYYFDTYIGRFSRVDTEGCEMTRDEVEPAALSALADAVRGTLPEMPIQDMSVNVRDEDDNPVFGASLVLNIKN